METIEKLLSQGWNISDDGLEIITNNGSIKDLKTITQNALNEDLKDIGKPVLSSELNKNKINQIVLQIQKIRNVSAPKSNEDSQAAPRMLKLILTDGHTHCQGIEIANISFLNLAKTPPGSKLLIKNAVVVCGYVLLDTKTCSFLGGQVPALYEKWEINKTMTKHTRGSYDGEGPPPWVSFGQKILASNDQQPFKSLEIKKEQAKDSDFDTQRQDAIAEAATGAVKKVFGGGVKQSIQQNNRYEQNKERNNQPRERITTRKNKREVGNEEKPQKPSEKVSLFDFLETKLPETSKNFTDSKPVNKNHNMEDGNKYRMNNFDRYNNVDKTQDKAPRFQNTKPNNYNGRNYNLTQNQSGYHNRTTNNPYIIKKVEPETVKVPLRKENTCDNANVDLVTHSVGRMSVNSEFASRSLRQHLNLGSKGNDYSAKNNISYDSKPKEQKNLNYSSQESNPHNSTDKQSNSFNTWTWKIGDQCMAKYWEDNKYYNATVTATTHRTCVVQFNEYGNFEEVLHCDCIPITNDEQDFNSGEKFPTEFRRGNKTYNKNFYKPRYNK